MWCSVFSCTSLLPTFIQFTWGIQLHCNCQYFVCLFWFFTSKSTISQSCWDRSSWVEPVLSSGKMSCSRIQHKDSAGDKAQTSNPSIPSLTIYQLSHCTPLYHLYLQSRNQCGSWSAGFSEASWFGSTLFQNIIYMVKGMLRVNQYKQNIYFMGHQQTVQNQFRGRRMLRLIRSCTDFLQNQLLKLGWKSRLLPNNH